MATIKEELMSEDYGFSAIDEEKIAEVHKNMNDSYKAALTKAENKLDQITTKMVVFFEKLAEDPTKTSLKWPNRAAVALRLKNEILTIRNS